MSNGAGAEVATLEQGTLVQAAIRRVRLQIDELQAISNRMTDMRARILGQHDDAPPKSDAPEPVRHDFEELNYQLGILGDVSGAISRQLSDLESI